MSKDQTKDLLNFLKPFPAAVQELAMWLREFVWDLYPETNEIIYDNYNALAFGWSITDRVSHLICNIAIGRTTKNIHFGFYWGKDISDPKKILIGEGNQYRYMLVKNKKDFPAAYIKKLLKESYANSFAKIKDHKLIVKGKTITKSISPVKRTATSKTKRKK